MARIRTIKPEFWTDSFMVQLPPLARLIYIALWTAADDHGLLHDEPERLAMEVMPKEDGLVFDDWMQLLEASGRIELMADQEGCTFYRIAKWTHHQRVDKPSKSRIFREGSRKVAVPLATRRAVATKYGCQPGEQIDAQCYYCGGFGHVHWHRLFNGRPSSWVTFPGLELDHLEAEAEGGSGVEANIVLACRNCNRSKGTRLWIEHLCDVNSVPVSRVLQRAREDSCEERNREQGTGKGKEQGSSSLRSDSESLKLTPPDDDGDNVHHHPAADRLSGTVLEAYHEALPSCQHVSVLNPKRLKRIRAADKLARQVCKQQGWPYEPKGFWEAYFDQCRHDPWLRGEVANPKNPRWKQNLDVLLAEDRFAEIMDKAIAVMREEDQAA